MISLDDFWMGRKARFPEQCTPSIQANASITVDRANRLLNAFYAARPAAATRHVNSGWRPPSVNAATPGAAPHSKHMTGEAIDISDDDGQLDDWINAPAGLSAITAIGLWAEASSATPRWAHLQIVPPRSGRRIFAP